MLPVLWTIRRNVTVPGLEDRLGRGAELRRHPRRRRDRKVGRGAALDGRVAGRGRHGHEVQVALHGEIDRAGA